MRGFQWTISGELKNRHNHPEEAFDADVERRIRKEVRPVLSPVAYF